VFLCHGDRRTRIPIRVRSGATLCFRISLFSASSGLTAFLRFLRQILPPAVSKSARTSTWNVLPPEVSMKSCALPLALLVLSLSLGCNRSRQVDMAAVSQPRASLAEYSPTSLERAKLPAGSVAAAIGGVPGRAAYIPQADKKVIHTAELSLVVDNVEEASAKIRSFTLRADGEIDQARIWSLSEKTREGELHIRIPAEGLES